MHKISGKSNEGVDIQSPDGVGTCGQMGHGKSPSASMRGTTPGDSKKNGRASNGNHVNNGGNDDIIINSPAGARHTGANSLRGGDGQHQQVEKEAEDGLPRSDPGRNSADNITGSTTWKTFRGNNSTRKIGDAKRRQGRENRKIMPFEGVLDEDASRVGEALTDPLVLAGQQLSTHLSSPGAEVLGGQGVVFEPPER